MMNPALAVVVEEACERVRGHLATAHFATIEAEMLASPSRQLGRRLTSTPGTLRSGTKPLLIVADDEGRTYALKIAPPRLLAAEEVAWELRQLGGRPAVPARRGVVLIDDVETAGLLKPYVDLHAVPELGADTLLWTEAQRAVMLREHAWEWFLDNLDTNTGQYALLGPDEIPVNIDWDRAFATDATSKLSRFKKHRPVLPNARTFLYSDFVEGKIDLPFALLAKEAERIHRLPRHAVARIVEGYARERFTTPTEIEAFVERVLERRRVIEYEVADFVRDLRRQRGALQRTPRSLRHRAANVATLVWDRWQVLLHAVQRGPVGGWGRKLLKLVRARRQTA